MVAGCISEDNSSDESVENLQATNLDDNDVEQICEAIFTLIPEVTRLKELFLCWSLLDAKAREEIDAQVYKWASPERVQLYKPLKEALRRWEIVQDTQGAPGCEPGMVTFVCDPQLEEEVINVICALEGLVEQTHRPSANAPHHGFVAPSKTPSPMNGLPDGLPDNIPCVLRVDEQSSEDDLRPAHKAQSAHAPKRSNSVSGDELSGYETD